MIRNLILGNENFNVLALLNVYGSSRFIFQWTSKIHDENSVFLKLSFYCSSCLFAKPPKECTTLLRWRWKLRTNGSQIVNLFAYYTVTGICCCFHFPIMCFQQLFHYTNFEWIVSATNRNRSRYDNQKTRSLAIKDRNITIIFNQVFDPVTYEVVL